MIRVEGPSVEDTFARANHLMLANRWGDGLPLWPPTRERVDWILRGTAQPRRRRLGTLAAARRRDHDRELRDRAGDGGRPARVPAGARRGGRGVPRRRIGQRAAAGGVGQRVSRGDRQRADRRADPAELRLRLSGSGSAAPGRRQHRPRAAPAAAEPRRRPARHRHDGELRRPALHERRLRRGRGESARRLGAARHRAPRLRAGHQLDLAGLRQRRDQHPPARRQEGDAGGGRAAGHVPHGRLHARAQHARPGRLRARHAGHPDDPGRGGPDDGRSRLDQGVDPRVPLGALADSGRASCGAPAARRGSRSTRARWCARASISTRGRSPPAPTTS